MTNFSYQRRNASFIYDWVSGEDLARIWASGEVMVHVIRAPFEPDGEDATLLNYRDAIIGTAPLVTLAPVRNVYDARTVVVPLDPGSKRCKMRGLVLSCRDRPVIFIGDMDWVPNNVSQGHTLTIYWDTGRNKVVDASDIEGCRQGVMA